MKTERSFRKLLKVQPLTVESGVYTVLAFPVLNLALAEVICGSLSPSVAPPDASLSAFLSRYFFAGGVFNGGGECAG
ncbi:hypothetical protein [Parendozoicomonas sp. Alg238-R29]|uniref:hypothetical protein n=1 Tax=Parendozoicomonas sp. Alg238-R29 TaxID=2993446 RepID=UPI00248DD26F|nr:hypothetical protein [Parendozoicomonas sp. Alg238-R29]